MERADGVREDPSSWSEVLRERVRQEEVGVIPFTLVLDYEHWSYRTYVGVYRTCAHGKQEVSDG